MVETNRRSKKSIKKLIESALILNKIKEDAEGKYRSSTVAALCLLEITMKRTPHHVGRQRSQHQAYQVIEPIVSNTVYRLVMFSSFMGFATAFFLLMNP